MIAYFDRFEIRMTKKQANSASHSGSCDNDVAELLRVPAIVRQLEKIPSHLIAEELLQYGAWDDEDVKDTEANKARIIWIAAGDITEGK